MKLSQPPKDAEPGWLFRKLLEFPRPVLPLDFRFSGAEDEPLFARAMSVAEKRACGAATGWRHNLVGLALCNEDGRPIFSRPNEAGQVISSESELSVLAQEVSEKLAIISPHYGGIDAQSWMNTLERGASESGHIAFALGTCIDLAGTMTSLHRTPRPDRFFGCPMRDLLDGHWLCWFAARRIVDKLSK